MIRPGTNFSTFTDAAIYESPLLERIRLAKQRARSNPVDSLDFIMIDLERPETLRRHAHFCTGDLTGRYLDFLSAGMHLEPSDRDRLDALFMRILKCQAPNGAFGRPYVQDMGCSEDDLVWGTAYKLFMGMLRYYMLTGNTKALTAAIRSAEFFISKLDAVKRTGEECRRTGGFYMAFWIIEPMALLYGITGDIRYLDLCRLIAGFIPDTMRGCHSHGLLTTLRGMNFASIYSGDLSFHRQAEKLRLEVAEHAVWPDGNMPEMLPMSGRNEGCSIADWMMLNLYSGFITGEDEAYEKAENTYYNALSFNQLVNGGFGTRELDKDGRGYSRGELSEECWWCCLHNSGLGLVEFANHAVTLRGGELRINLLVPGRYTAICEGRTVTVDITTRYPEKADTLIFVNGAPDSMKIRVRIPSWIRKADLRKDSMPGGGIRYALSGKMGYTLEEVKNGVVLRYGPLVMVPLMYSYSMLAPEENEDTKGGVPKGYIPSIMPEDRPAIIPVEKDGDGFLLFAKNPRPDWQYYEEGSISRLAYESLSANVPLYFKDGRITYLRFYPECNSTTTMAGMEVPLVFNKG